MKARDGDWTLALLDAAPDAIIVVDADGSIQLVNQQAVHLFGYSREEFLGMAIEELVPEALRHSHPGNRRAYAAHPTARPMGADLQLSAQRRDGTTFAADISLSSVTAADGSLRVVAACRDVTDRRAADAERERLRLVAERSRLEAQLQASQRLESLGQLAGGVAHDFNNLLAVITNFAAFAVEELTALESRDPGIGAIRNDVEQIQLAAQRATTLTHQLLMFGRRDVVRARVLQLNEIIRELEPMLRRTLGEHIELVTYLDHDLARIMADRGQMEQVLVNLAVNARDAMPNGGKLSIETANTRIDEDHPASASELAHGRFVRLRVSDTGTGMADDVKQRAFEPFFTTKPRGEGSGLGLATVYGIVTQSHGWCGLYSEIDVGTAVTILLPATEDSPDEEQPRLEMPSVSAQHRRVLLVEDEPALRQIAVRILARHRFEVVEASHAAEALDLLTRDAAPFDLLLTDVVMPGMLGRELADRAGDLQPGLPVLFMSGYAQPLLTSQGHLTPGVALVEKPFTEAALITRVQELLAEPGGTEV